MNCSASWVVRFNGEAYCHHHQSLPCRSGLLLCREGNTQACRCTCMHAPTHMKSLRRREDRHAEREDWGLVRPVWFGTLSKSEIRRPAGNGDMGILSLDFVGEAPLPVQSVTLQCGDRILCLLANFCLCSFLPLQLVGWVTHTFTAFRVALKS